MNSSNAILSHFTVAGQKLPVAHFSLLEALSAPNELRVTVKLPGPMAVSVWLGQPVHFSIKNEQGQARQWHLVCEEVNQEGSSAHLVCRSHWSNCFQSRRTQRVFCQASLPDLVQSMIANTDWELSHEAWEREQIVQCAESDGEFIQRICGRENIQWFSRHDSQGETIHFIDHPRFLKHREKALIYRPPQIFQEDPNRESVFDLEWFARGPLQEDEWINDLPMRLYAGIPCMQAGVRSAGMPVKSYRRLSYEPDLLAKALKERVISFRDHPESGYRAVRLKSNLIDLTSGLIVDLASESGVSYAQGIYRLNYVYHTGTTTQGGEMMIYQNSLIAQDNQSPWRGILYSRPHLPLVFHATIESAHEVTYLDQKGRETVRSLLDTHASENTRASIPLPRLTPYAHRSGGMQLPLYPGTEVLMTCLYGEADLPVIIGAVYNDKSASPVNNANPRINMIRTQQDQTFILDDSPNAPLISLSTQSGHRWLMRNRETPGIFVDCIGGMILSSHGKCSWFTGKNFALWAGKTYRQRASVGQLIQTKKGNILFKAALDMKIHALHQIEYYAKRHRRIFCNNKTVRVKGNQTITVEQGDARFKIQGASLIETRDQITLSSLNGDLIMKNQAGNCGIQLTQAGEIRVFGQQIISSTDLLRQTAVINHQ